MISISDSNNVPNFLPSKSGLHFGNFYPSHTSYSLITLPVVGTIISGDAGNGICGGFSYAVLDLFLARLQPPPDTDLPASGSAGFNYLIDRFLDSFGSAHNGYSQVKKLIEWIQLPDYDVTIPFHVGLGLRIIEDEWPQIKADIDSGRPSALMLAMSPKCGLGDISCIITALSHSHQVLVYGYTMDNNNLTLSIYDCNHPDSDSQTILLNISHPEHKINIMAPGIPYTIRGFFRSDYSRKNPAGFMAAFPPILKDGTLLKSLAKEVYAIYGGAKFLVPSSSVLNMLNILNKGIDIRSVLKNTLDDIPRVPVEGTLLREESSSQVYVILNGRKKRLESSSVAGQVHVLWNGALAQIP
jgi:hypothetical protein